MESVKKLTGYADLFKRAQRELEALEKKAAKLAEQDEGIRQKRESLTGQISEQEQAITALETEDAGMKPELLEAMMQDDVQEQRVLKERRKAIADDIRQREAELGRLTTALECLPDLEHATAELAIELEDLDIPNGYTIVDELRASLRKDSNALQNRLSEARRCLPSGVLRMNYVEAVRAGVGLEEYQQTQRDRQRQIREELERKEKERRAAANTQFIGTGPGGRPRAATIAEASELLKQ